MILSIIFGIIAGGIFLFLGIGIVIKIVEVILVIIMLICILISFLCSLTSGNWYRKNFYNYD